MNLADYPIEITVFTDYLVEDSDPQDNYYLFDYRISIQNKGDKTVTLLSRQWIITDGNGHKKEVKGSGVVGQQPCIKAGETFEYTSSANFSTPVGSMYGKYSMQVETGELFDAHIAPFRLAAPGVLH